jgi:hypothetical protein
LAWNFTSWSARVHARLPAVALLLNAEVDECFHFEMCGVAFDLVPRNSLGGSMEAGGPARLVMGAAKEGGWAPMSFTRDTSLTH